MRLAWVRIAALADKELRHIMRDVRVLYLALAMPLVMLLIFGFGVSFDVEHVPLAVVDLDDSQASRGVRRRLLSGERFDDGGSFGDVDGALAAVVRGEAMLVVAFERGFARDLARGREPGVQLLIDGSDNSTATQARLWAEQSLVAAIKAVGRDGNVALPLEVRPFLQFNPSGRSAVFLVPGIAAYVLSLVAVLLTALTVAREWEEGSMLQLFVTPVRHVEIVVGKLLPYLGLGLLAVLLVVAAGGLIFQVPFRGSPLALSMLALLFLVGMLGQGLLVSVLTKNQMVATQVATMSSMLPSLLLSGFVFPIESMPRVVQFVTYALPARYFVSGLRGVLLRGNGFAELWAEMLCLLAFGTLVLALAVLRFHRSRP